MRDTIYFYKRDLEKTIQYLKDQKFKEDFWIGHIDGLDTALERLNEDIALTKRLGDY